MIVRVFGYRGMRQMPNVLPRYYTSETVFQLSQPYEWRDDLTTAGLTPVSSAAQAAPDKTEILRVEVPDGQSIRYEINPPSRAVPADANSPILSGINMFEFHQGWTLSVIDASGT